MTTQKAPWDNDDPAPERLPSTPAPSGGQLADIERLMNLFEGFMDRVYPRFQGFLQGVQQAQAQARAQKGPPDGVVIDNPGSPNPGSVNEPVQPQPVINTVDAETVYGYMFDLLNMVSDDMTCTQMRVHIRDNKEAIVGALKVKLGG